MRSSALILVAGLAGALAPGCGSSSSAVDAGGTPDALVVPDAPPPDAGYVPGTPVTASVASVFPAGTVLRDAYGGGGTVTVAADGTVTLTPDPNGVVLLEKDGAAASAFTWADVTVYNAIVDRYANGDTANDHSYGRTNDGQMEVGTWHGGDWKGLTSKLDYIAGLGVSAIWITPIVEQVHGWASGGTGDFKYYGYHGYWALDFTRLDANFGTQDDLQALIDGAHQRGLRVLVDVVMNHPGYATGADMVAYLPEVFFDTTGAAFTAFDGTATAHFDTWNNLVNYNSLGWKNWWSPKWIRAGFPGFPAGGSDDLTKQLTFLPDFITEGTQAADEPILFERKADTGFVAEDGFTVRQYLVKWHTDWVQKLGIDGFRCDTAKNVELASWHALKQAGLLALADWKTANPTKKLDDAPFWMTAEVFPHSVVKDNYYTDGGFDSVINFDFQRNVTSILQVQSQLAAGASDLETLYAGMAGAIGGDPTFGILSYVSSHDTRLNFAFFANDPAKQRAAGTALLLAPGGVEIFYGDESGRPNGPALSDSVQATRSDMNFATTDASILDHWQKLGTFRKKHAAVGAGAHQRLDSPPGTYAFSRKLDTDSVVVIITPTH